MRQMIASVAFGFALALTPLVAHSQTSPETPVPDEAGQNEIGEGHEVIRDIDRAKSAGFTEISIEDNTGTAQRDLVNREFMQKLETKGRIYGFSFATLDLNGDGYRDLILMPRGTQFPPPKGSDGLLTLVYLFDGQNWRLALKGGSMGVWEKSTDPTNLKAPKDLAFIQQEPRGFQRFSLDGWKYVRVQ